LAHLLGEEKLCISSVKEFSLFFVQIACRISNKGKKTLDEKERKVKGDIF